MSEFINQIGEKLPEVDKHGFTIKPPISDRDCILICLNNAPCGTDKKQVERIIKEFELKETLQ